MQTTVPIQREMIAELSSKRPEFVVIESQWDNAREPNGSALSSGVTILDDYIRGHFTPVATFGTVSVLQDRNRHAASSSAAPGVAGEADRSAQHP